MIHKMAKHYRKVTSQILYNSSVRIFKGKSHAPHMYFISLVTEAPLPDICAQMFGLSFPSKAIFVLESYPDVIKGYKIFSCGNNGLSILQGQGENEEIYLC